MTINLHEFCSVISSTADEPIAGQATHVYVWLVLEYSGTWESKALFMSDLPDPIKQHLMTAQKEIDGGRVQFIKQDKAEPPYRFYVANSQAGTMHRFDLNSYNDLLNLNLHAIAAGDAAYDDHRVDKRLLLICTNSKRDACCAKFGLASAQTAIEAAPDIAFQTTHLGGHRFAPTGVVLPEGYHYGRIQSGDVESILSLLERGHVSVEHLRGRTIYDGPVQAAEIALYRMVDETEVGRYTLIRSVATSDIAWKVIMQDTQTGQEYAVAIESRAFASPVISSCGDEETEYPATYVATIEE